MFFNSMNTYVRPVTQEPSYPHSASAQTIIPERLQSTTEDSTFVHFREASESSGILICLMRRYIWYR